MKTIKKIAYIQLFALALSCATPAFAGIFASHSLFDLFKSNTQEPDGAFKVGVTKATKEFATKTLQQADTLLDKADKVIDTAAETVKNLPTVDVKVAHTIDAQGLDSALEKLQNTKVNVKVQHNINGPSSSTMVSVVGCAAALASLKLTYDGIKKMTRQGEFKRGACLTALGLTGTAGGVATMIKADKIIEYFTTK